MFADTLSRFWWMTLIRGVVWILFGVAIYINPAISLLALTVTFGVIALADGAVTLVSAIGRRHQQDHWWMLLIGGIAGIALGLLTLASPGITALLLLYYVGFWAISTGLIELVAAIRLRREIQGEFWLALAGVLSMAFGAFVLARPGEGALSVLWLIALFSIAFGVMLIGVAFRTRGFVNRVTAATRMPPM